MQRLIPNCLRLFLLAIFCFSGVVSAQTSDDTAAAEAVTDEAPVKKGKLRIKSSPAGAKVWIDHVEVGRTPLEVSLPAGKHKVRISKDRHQPHNVTVKVVAHRVRPINVELKKGNGEVVFDTDIEDAILTIKSKDFETFPLRLKSLKEATYQYRVTAPGYEPLSGEFTWKKGKNVYIWLKLESSLGRFVVNTTPPGSTVWLDGAEVGVTPLELEGISQAKHVVHVRQKGFADLIRIVDTTDGSTGEVDVKLADKGARLIVWTGSKEGTLMVEGVAIGEGRRIAFPKLEKGKYEVEIQAPTKKTAKSWILVPNRGFARFRGSLKGSDSRGRSTIKRIKPFYAHWGFWTAVGVSASGATTGSVLYWQAIQPIPIDRGDQTVSVP